MEQVLAKKQRILNRSYVKTLKKHIMLQRHEIMLSKLLCMWLRKRSLEQLELLLLSFLELERQEALEIL